MSEPGSGDMAVTWRVYTEDWDPAYGNAAAFDSDSSDQAQLVESGDVPTVDAAPAPLAFVDGCRRAELSLWAEDTGSTQRVPGLAGAYAVGAVTVSAGRSPQFQGVRVGRVLIWGGGRSGDLLGRSGYRWVSDSTAATEPSELLARLQDRMRLAEGRLALDAAAQGWNVVLDGPLNRIRDLHELVAGYVKSHHRRLLSEEDHATVPSLAVGERTALYALGSDRYTCYVRVGWPKRGSSPWGGIARLEFPAAAGLDSVAARASQLAPLLAHYAGAVHRDPRAPVNLTPVKNLENHLTHLFGRVDQATRAARDAVIDHGVATARMPT